MSIYNKTWAVDEEITSDSLNQMSADIGNTTNDIHSQYDNSLINADAYNLSFIYNGAVVAPSGLYYPARSSVGIDISLGLGASTTRISSIDFLKSVKNIVTLKAAAFRHITGGCDVALSCNIYTVAGDDVHTLISTGSLIYPTDDAADHEITLLNAVDISSIALNTHIQLQILSSYTFTTAGTSNIILKNAIATFS